jgi:pimeloyl-ACP methyl ester carboxylesterase
VVGHSFGGRVAIKLAARHPKLVRSLVLTGVPFGKKATSKKPPLSLRLAKTLSQSGVVSKKRLDALRDRHGSADYRAAQGVMRDVLVKAVNEEYFDDCRRISHRVRLVWGEDDQPAPLDLAKKAQGFLPHATLHVVPGSGHLLDAPLTAALQEAIAEALADSSGGGG